MKNGENCEGIQYKTLVPVKAFFIRFGEKKNPFSDNFDAITIPLTGLFFYESSACVKLLEKGFEPFFPKATG